MNKKALLATVLVATAGVPAVSMAQLSANVGWVSEYIFRGVFQEDTSASGGVDYESGGFYIGTWGADVGSGLETDVYFGYGGGEDFTWGIGYTGYFYTDDWDDTYQEVNLSIGYGIFELTHNVGEWDGFGFPADYTFSSITIAPDVGPYYTFGSWGDDFDGDYFELGYGFEVSDVEMSIALIFSDDLQVSNPADGDFGEYALVFGIGKTFEFE